MTVLKETVEPGWRIGWCLIHMMRKSDRGEWCVLQDMAKASELCELITLVPDTTVQAIADAWSEGYDDAKYRNTGQKQLKRDMPELADLLDALIDDQSVKEER